MAQKLENARGSLMKYGKNFLLQNRDGLAGRFNVRDLTSGCGMALGTFYRYFDSKDDLVRQIMMEDWMKIMRSIDSEIQSSRSLYEKLKFIYVQICNFEQVYRYSAMNLLSQTEENRVFKEKCLEDLQNKVADFLTAEIDRNELQLTAKTDAAAYLLIQLISATARNPALSFDDLWQCMNFRDISIRKAV
ncbi:MAG: TetR/AcrR family transcriptional regulator [Lachnospiraceae bacterium]|nr:TetR/AcrR family transcriptional regulator [Lachnospiraceae bacterium]